MMEESCSAFPTIVIVGHGHIYFESQVQVQVMLS